MSLSEELIIDDIFQDRCSKIVKAEERKLNIVIENFRGGIKS